MEELVLKFMPILATEPTYLILVSVLFTLFFGSIFFALIRDFFRW